MAEDWAIDVYKYVPDADAAAIAGIVRYCGIALRTRDASLVAFSDPVETGRVRENFLKKKLALTDADDVLNAAIARVGAIMTGDNTKNRVTVYYLLAQAYDKLGLFGGKQGDDADAGLLPLVAPAAKIMHRAPAGDSGWGDYTPFLVLVLGGLLVFGIIRGGGPQAPAAEPAAAPVAVAAPAPVIPTGAGIIVAETAGRPVVSVYFDTAKADVDPALEAKSATLRAYLSAHPDTHLQVSGYNDPRGDAAFNAELSKKRAFSVRDGLVALGVPATAIDLVKPTDTSDASASLAEARRVDVTIVDGPVPAA